MGFSAGEGVEGLAEAEVVEAEVGEGAEGVENFCFLGGFLCRGAGDGGGGAGSEEPDRFRDSEVEDVGDGFPLVGELESGAGVAGAVALGAGEVEVGEELHLDLFEAVAPASFAASGARVEGKVSGGESGEGAVGAGGKEFADQFEGTEIDDGGRAGGAGEGGLVDDADRLDGEFFGEFEGFDRGGIVFGLEAELSGDVLVNDVVDEGGFAGSGDAGDAAEDAEGDIGVEFVDVVAGGAADFDEGGGFAAGLGDGDGAGAGEEGGGDGGGGGVAEGGGLAALGPRGLVKTGTVSPRGGGPW